MTRVSLQAIRRTITVDWRNKVDSEAKALLIRTARDGTAQIVNDQMSRAGVKPGVETYANFEGNSNLDSVKLPGPIVSNFTYLGEIVQETLKALIQASPRDSGEYIAGHTIYVNGDKVSKAPDRLGPSDQIIIANRVPYARKIEVGVTESGRAFVIKVDPHIYERVMSNVIRPKYRNTAKITFSFVSLPDAYVAHKGVVKYPAIIIGAPA